MTHIELGCRPFYKYASPEATLAILRSRAVRYSSPLTFNDPFDVQSGLHIDFDLNTLQEKILDRLYELAVATNEPTVDPADVWGKLVLEVRRHFATQGFPRERWEALSAESFERMAGIIRTYQQEYQQKWWNTFLPSVRAFCVSEDRDNLLMWSHYAKEHTGTVMEFWSLPDEDNPLSVARPIEYVATPPPFFTESEWLDDLTGIKQLDSSALYHRYAICKSRHWSYEREWRVWYPKANGELYEYMPIRESEFKAIYVGCRAEPEFIGETVTLARAAFPNIRILQAKKNDGSYSLGYNEI